MLNDCATTGVVFQSTGTNCLNQNWLSLTGHVVLTPAFTIVQPPAIAMPACVNKIRNLQFQSGQEQEQHAFVQLAAGVYCIDAPPL